MSATGETRRERRHADQIRAFAQDPPRRSGVRDLPTSQATLSMGEVRTTLRDGVTVASIAGEIDLSNAESIGSRLIAEAPAGGRGLVLDLSEVTFLDSFGISVIFGMRETLQARKQPLALVIPQASAVVATFKAAGLLERLRPAETVEGALNAIRKDEAYRA